MKNWNAEELKAALEKLKVEKKIFAFVASITETERQEYYLIQDAKTRVALDQSRQVDSQKIVLNVYVQKENGRLGNASKPLIPFQPLAEQIDSVISSARLGDQEAWDFPALPSAESAGSAQVFPALKENFQGGATVIYNDLSAAVANTPGIFNSAELFVNLIKTRRIVSNGLDRISERSKIYTEVCYSSEEKGSGNSEEFLLTEWYSHPEQLELKKMCEDSRDFAEASLKTVKPLAGNFDVILAADVLNQVWNSCLGQFDSSRQYLKHPFKEVGSEFMKDFNGEKFELSIDPKVNYCFASADYDSVGLPQKRLPLVSGNKVVNSTTDSRYGQYLKKPITSSFGCLVIDAKGEKSLQELRKAKPKVLEILQFSGLFTDEMNLTYSSEIRLARLWDNEKGTCTFIKGGNLSGNLLENFREVQWSKEQKLLNHSDYSGSGVGYQGPAYALISNVAVSS